MWKKYHDIAQRQLDAGKLKTVAMHANKALEFARKENNKEQIARTLRLLSELSVRQQAPDAEKQIRAAIEAMEAAGGGASVELAREYKLLASVLRDSDAAESEVARENARRILRELNDIEAVIDSLDVSVVALLENNRPNEAEERFLEAVQLCKRFYGPYSDAMAEKLDIYIKILQAQGRNEEVEDYNTWNFLGCRATPDVPFIMDRESVASIIRSTQEQMKDKEIAESLVLMRQAADALKKEAEEAVAKFPPDDPFKEYRAFVACSAQRWAEAGVGELMRIKGMNEESKELVTQAKEHLQRVFDESHGTQGREQLIFTLFDLKEPGYAAAVERLLQDAHESVTSKYSEALALFVKEGSTTNSRRAMSDAIDYNATVPFVFMEAAQGKEYEAKDEAGQEAVVYARYTLDHWVDTDGALDFMMGQFAHKMKSLAKTLDRDTLMSMLSAAGM